MSSLTEAQLTEFLEATVNERNFHIFAALTNLGNSENFKKVIEYLYKRRINLFDIADLDIIDDQAIEQLLRKLNRFHPDYLSVNSEDDTDVNYEVAEFFYDDSISTPLTRYMSGFNNWINKNFDKLTNEDLIDIRLYKLDLDKSHYKSTTDAQLDFNRLVTDRLLKEYGVEDVLDIIPTLFPDIDNTTVEDFNYWGEREFLRTFSNMINGIFQSSFNNSNLFYFFVTTDDVGPSVLETEITFLTGVLRYETYNKNIHYTFNNEINNFLLNKDSTEFTTDEIRMEWELTGIANNFFRDYQILSLLQYFEYRVALVNHIMQKQLGSSYTSDKFFEYMEELKTWIQKYSEIHSKIDKIILSSLDLETY